MEDYYSFLVSGKRRRFYYLLLFIIAFIAAIAVYLFFNFQTPIYQSSGKFAVFYDGNSASSNVGLQTNSDLTKSVAETIKSRFFLEKVSQSAGVKFNEEDLNSKIDNIVKADVVTNSNILEVKFFNKEPGNLDKINNIFLSQLNSSKIVAGSNSHIDIQTIDPLYTLQDPVFPKPLTYALVVFAVTISGGLLLIYSLTP